jgi:transposase
MGVILANKLSSYKKGGFNLQATTLGIDLAKNIFQLHGINECGKVVKSRKVTRSKLREVKPKLPCCLIGMEACSSSN